MLISKTPSALSSLSHHRRIAAYELLETQFNTAPEVKRANNLHRKKKKRRTQPKNWTARPYCVVSSTLSRSMLDIMWCNSMFMLVRNNLQMYSALIFVHIHNKEILLASSLPRSNFWLSKHCHRVSEGEQRRPCSAAHDYSDHDNVLNVTVRYDKLGTEDSIKRTLKLK